MPQANEEGTIAVLGAHGRDPLSIRFHDAGATVLVAQDLDELDELLARRPVPVVAVDLRVIDAPWMTIAGAVHGPASLDEGAGPALLAVGDDDHWGRVESALDAGAADCLRLPASAAELRARVRSALAPADARADERRTLGESIHGDTLQVLAALTMRLQLLGRRGEPGTPVDEADATDELRDIIDEMGMAVERLRKLDFQLRKGGRAVSGPTTGTTAATPTPSMWASPELLSRLSHDLRSPLNAVLGFAQLLELGDLTPDQLDATRQIMRAGTRLLELVNEVVDLSRIEAGHLSVSLEAVDLTEVVSDAIRLLQPAAVECEVTVRALGMAAGERSSVSVLADRQRLLQVVLILLSNAVRYNEPGGTVQIDAHLEGSRLRVSVIDDGMGISPAQLHNVFVPFDRLGVDKQGIAGAGLGLPIAKGLVTRMGGDIDVRSVQGSGATFSFDLRVAPSQQGPSDEDTAADGAVGQLDESPFEVLYIEDNPASLRLVERVLGRRPGVTLIPAMQGRLGVQLAVQRRPSMVLCDLHLPDMTGMDVVRALTAEPLTKDIPIVVLSADADRQQSELAVAEGARAYLSKPFQIEALLSLVDELRRELARTGSGGRP